MITINGKPYFGVTRPAPRMDEDSLRISMGETKDCTVRATAVALDVTYAEAHRRLAALGRKPRNGVLYANCAPKLGLVQRPDLSSRMWKTVQPMLAKGRFVVRVAHHVFAVVDGVATEGSKPCRRIKMVYEVPQSFGQVEIPMDIPVAV